MSYFYALLGQKRLSFIYMYLFQTGSDYINKKLIYFFVNIKAEIKMKLKLFLTTLILVISQTVLGGHESLPTCHDGSIPSFVSALAGKMCNGYSIDGNHPPQVTSDVVRKGIIREGASIMTCYEIRHKEGNTLCRRICEMPT